MSEYKGIKGFQVTTRTEDPVPYAQALADNPYGGVWGAGGNLNNARLLFDSGVGSLTAGLVAGNSPSPNAETYNGTSWTNISSLGNNTAGRAGAGTSTAALEFGGTPGLGVTEYWNGSSWTELSDMNQGRNHLAGCGASNTSALAFGGEFSPLYPSQGYLGLTESWNGSAWTEVADLNTDRAYVAGLGTQTAALCISGTEPPLSTKTEDWNGISWQEVSDVSTARMGSAAAGNSTNGLAFGGGTPGVTAATEEWNGTSNTTRTVDTD